MQHGYVGLAGRVKAMLVSACVVLYGCASVVNPTGGKKDITPPVLTGSDPASSTTNFTSEKIVLSFDEYVQLKDVEKQLIISPIIKPAPIVSAKAKKVVVEIKADLSPNTTYTLNFGDAIIDLRESNPIKDFRYVFSTGSVVDTMELAGKVFSAENLQAQSNILIMLYKTEDDSAPLKSTPGFFTRTDSSGNFRLRNISTGPYKLFALKDADGDYKHNTPDELIGYVQEPVSGSDSMPVTIYLFKETEKKLTLRNGKFENKASCSMVFNRSVRNVTFTDLSGSTQWKNLEFNTGGDTVIVWLKDTLVDSLRIQLSENGVPLDTVNFIQSVKSERNAIAPLKMIVSSRSGTNPLPGKPIVVQTTLPVQSFDENLISLTHDSITPVAFTVEMADTLKRTFKIIAPTVEKKGYTLKFLPGAFKSDYGKNNDTTIIALRTPMLTEFGSVKVKLSGLTEGNYLLQVVSDKDEIKYEKKLSDNGNYLFENIVPAIYKLRLVNDKDANGMFTTGDYIKKQQPEKVKYYTETINIRANWDIEVDWNAGADN